MRATCPSGSRRWWFWGIVIYAFGLLACWPVLKLEGGTQGGGRDHPLAGARITADKGRLSVELTQADLQAVLSQIGEQAGITIIMDPADHRKITAEFANVALDDGIRRLLRGASCSHTILYTRDAAGAIAIKEIRVFGEERGSEPGRPAIAEAGGDASADNALLHGWPSLRPTPNDFPHPPETVGNPVAAGFQEAFELARRSAAQPASHAEEGRENDMVHAFRKALQQKPR
jgi:hypothetical protein